MRYRLDFFLTKTLLLFFGIMDVVKFKYETAPYSFLVIMKTTLQQKINTLIQNIENYF